MLSDKIIIGCYEYKVVETDKPLVLNGRECGGTIDYRNHLIEISTDMDEQAREQTFWHEVLHGIVHYRNVDLKDSDDETIVEEIATGLYGLLKANGLLPGQAQRTEMEVTPFGTVKIPDDIKPGQWLPFAPFKGR